VLPSWPGLYPPTTSSYKEAWQAAGSNSLPIEATAFFTPASTAICHAAHLNIALAWWKDSQSDTD
jgi:hypothetical protein